MSNFPNYTYIVVWAGSGEMYSLIRCNDETYARQVVADFDGLSGKENRELASFCAKMLNTKTKEQLHE